jgi:DNA repair protein RadC
MTSPEAGAQPAQSWNHPGGKLLDHGAHSLKQDELLAILVGAGIRGRPASAIAEAILDKYVGLYGIHKQATAEELSRIPGVGPRKAGRILAAVELGRRLHAMTMSVETGDKLTKGLFSHAVPIRSESRGSEPANDADLLAAVIGSGVRGRPSRAIAQELLGRFDSLLGLFGQDMGSFLTVKGLSSVKIIRVAAALEIAKRVAHALR